MPRNGGLSRAGVHARLMALKPDLRLTSEQADRLLAAADFTTSPRSKFARFSPRGRTFFSIAPIARAWRSLVGLDPPDYVAARFEAAPGEPTIAEFCAALHNSQGLALTEAAALCAAADVRFNGRSPSVLFAPLERRAVGYAAVVAAWRARAAPVGGAEAPPVLPPGGNAGDEAMLRRALPTSDRARSRAGEPLTKRIKTEIKAEGAGPAPATPDGAAAGTIKLEPQAMRAEGEVAALSTSAQVAALEAALEAAQAELRAERAETARLRAELTAARRSRR